MAATPAPCPSSEGSSAEGFNLWAFCTAIYQESVCLLMNKRASQLSELKHRESACFRVHDRSVWFEVVRV